VRTKLLALVTAMLLAVTAAVPASAITNGTPDGDDHPYVGILVFDTLVEGTPTPSWRCSGSLISPTVVLTAGHCTDGAVAARVWFAEDVTYAAVPFPLYPYGGAGSGAVEGTPFTNPDYRSADNPYGGGNGLPAFSYRDVGVVVLDTAVQMSEYAQLPDAGLVDTLASQTSIDFVGYGVQEQVMTFPGQSPRARWTGLRVRMYAPGELVSGKFVHSAEFLRASLNPGGGSGGTCFGDSGGPDLLGGTSTVLAVNSYVTNVNCAGVGYGARVDIPEVLEWILSYDHAAVVIPAVEMFPGSVYDNPYQIPAASGLVHWSQPTGLDISLDLATTGLAPATVYTVYIDTNGVVQGNVATAGPWQTVGTYTTDATGRGSFSYSASGLAPGVHTWSIWVNSPYPASVLVSYNVVFTVPAP
jgi:hypothetical protein